MADFNFITVPELRQCLEGDYRELRTCLEAGAWKAVHVLAGSIVEAVLVDALYAEKGLDTSKLDSWQLAEIIRISKQRDIISEDSEHLSTVIRQYRNLIHPGRIKRLEKIVEKSGAVVAAELVELICKGVAKRKAETYGYTAEQLFKRLTSGASALPLLTHLLRDSSETEIGRLLIDLFPTAYASAISESDVAELDHIESCYRNVFEQAPENVRRLVAKRLYEVYRTKDESIVLMYEDTFLRGSDLKYLNDEEQHFIIAHLLPRLNVDSLLPLLKALIGIGSFLTADEAYTLTAVLFHAIIEGHEKLKSLARVRLYLEYDRMGPEARVKVQETVASFRDWAGQDDPTAALCDKTLAELQRKDARITASGKHP